MYLVSLDLSFVCTSGSKIPYCFQIMSFDGISLPALLGSVVDNVFILDRCILFTSNDKWLLESGQGGGCLSFHLNKDLPWFVFAELKKFWIQIAITNLYSINYWRTQLLNCSSPSIFIQMLSVCVCVCVFLLIDLFNFVLFFKQYILFEIVIYLLFVPLFVVLFFLCSQISMLIDFFSFL